MLTYLENPPAFFGGYVPFLGVKYFTEKCREVYFCIQDYSDAAFIITTFCMYGLFHEYGGMEKDVTMREEHHHYIEMCRNNLETALANLNILMPANHDSIMALSLGVSAPFPFYLLFRYTPSGSLFSLLTNTGYACTRDFQTIRCLDTCIHGHESLPDTGISSPYFNGA